MQTQNTVDNTFAKDDVFTPTKKHTFFKNAPIANIVKLGRTDFTKAETPLQDHTHNHCFEVCYHYNGRQQYQVGNEFFETKSGDVFITFPHELHGSGNMPEEKSGLFYLIFDCPEKCEDFMGLNKKDSVWISHTLYSCKNRLFLGTPKMKVLLHKIMNTYFSAQPMKQACIHALFVQFFYELCTQILLTKPQPNLPSDIQIVKNYIHANLQQNCDVQTLAKQVHLSVSQLSRKFKQSTGFSVYDYSVRAKIAFAKEMLQSSKISITQISVDLGFSSSQHFASVFKKYVGITPSDYRKTHC